MSTGDTRTEPDPPTATATTVDADATLPAGGPADAPPPGTPIGRFDTVRTIGTGGMGVVLEAHDPELDRRIAIKLMKPSAARGDSSSPARLQREAQAMAKLAHPNVVAVFDAGRWGEQTFIAMELVEGTTLREWQKAKRPWQDVVRMYIAAGRGLAAAHAAGLIHRDFKPDNVLVGADGRPRVSDFGLVAGDQRLGDADVSGPLSESLTVDGAAMGTPAYMSPEHWAGAGVDARSDQFSFCVSLWEALFGPRPFQGPTIVELRKRVTGGEITPLDERRVPAWLETALRRGLSRDPAARWPDMPALLADLERRLAPRRRAAILVLAAGALAAGALIAFVATRPAATPACPDPRARLAGIWDAAKAEQVRAAFLATGHPEAARAADRFIAALDQHADAWVSMQKDACEATRIRKTAPQNVLEQRTACLDDHVVDLAELTDAFASVKTADAVDRADEAARDLRSLDDCQATTSASAPPVDPETRAARAEIRRLVAASKAQVYLGNYDQAHELAALAIAAARELGEPNPLIEALYNVGRTEIWREDYRAAEAALREGGSLAAATENDHDVALVYALLMYVLAEELDDVPGALALRPIVEASLNAEGRSPELEILVNDGLHPALHRSGDIEGALALAKRSLELVRTHRGNDVTDLVDCLLDIANLYVEREEWTAAGEVVAEALPLAEAGLGPEHPQTAHLLHVAAQIAKGQGDLDRAQKLLDRALAIRMNRYGRDSEEVLMALLTLGNLKKRRGDLEGARALFEERLAALERDPLRQGRDIASALWTVAQIHFEQGDHAGAEPYFDRAFATADEVFGHDSVDYIKIENDYAESLRAQKRFADAISHFEHIVAVASEKWPKYVPAWIAIIGECYVELGDKKKAREYLRRAETACDDKCGEESKAEIQTALAKLAK